MTGRHEASLFAQVLGLVIVSLLAAHAISLAILFSLPPPPPEPYRVSDVIAAFQHPGVSRTSEGRPLIARIRPAPPRELPDSPRRELFREQLAQELGVTPDRVVISSNFMRPVMIRMHHHDPDRPSPPGMGEFRMGPPQRPDPVIFAPFKVAVHQADGRWLTVQPKPAFRWASWQGRVLLTLLLSIMVISPLAWLFARRLSQPFAAFAEGAERLGRDPNAPPLDISGSGEVGAAVAAFNGMQERLRRYVHDRTAMVGAIAHDMRTPLTRMRFRIESAPDELKTKLEQDIDQMDAMVTAALSFVHDTTAPAERTKLELASLVESVIDEAAETGADAAIESGERIVVDGDPLALKRMVANLVENAVKYGGSARGRVFAEHGQAIVEIDDEGPGIPPSEMERVFDPFYRGEPSRSHQTGGAGLGLAVVRSIARAHGGDVTLRNRPGKGLTARLALPL
ncbi:MAG: ATP-binding protein [Ignavibacteriales bacterium]